MNAPVDELDRAEAEAAATQQMSDLIRSRAGRSAGDRRTDLADALAELDAAKASGDEGRIADADRALDALLDRARETPGQQVPSFAGARPPASLPTTPAEAFNQSLRAARHLPT